MGQLRCVPCRVRVDRCPVDGPSHGLLATGVSSTGKVEIVRSLGADHVLDYTQVDYTTTGERYDWILDTDSHHSIRRVRRALRPNGVYVTLGGTAIPILQGMIVGPLISIRSDRSSGLMLWWKPFNPADVAILKELIAAGKLKPVIDRRFPLSEIVETLRYVDAGRERQGRHHRLVLAVPLERTGPQGQRRSASNPRDGYWTSVTPPPVNPGPTHFGLAVFAFEAPATQLLNAANDVVPPVIWFHWYCVE